MFSTRHGGTMHAFAFCSLPGGRRRVRSLEVSGFVRSEFPNQPYLADFLEQCFTDLHGKRWPGFHEKIGARLLTEPALLATLRKLRVLLAEEFSRPHDGRRPRSALAKSFPGADALPVRSRELLYRFMPFRHNELAMLLAQEPKVAARLTHFTATFRAFLDGQKGIANERWSEHLLVHIATLAWLAVVPNNDAVGTRDGVLVDALLGAEAPDDDTPTYVPSPEDRAKTTYRSPLPPEPPRPPPLGLRVIK